LADLQQLTDLIEPEARALGFDLVRVRLFGAGDDRTLQIMAERPDTRQLTIDDCSDLSHRISDRLDALEEAGKDPIEGAYRLEVSSPGIDRPLTRLQDYTDWAGHEARITLAEKIDGRKQFKGDLDGVEGDNVAVTTADGTRHTIPFAAIEDAKLTMTDRLLKATMPLSMEGADEQELDETAEDTEDQD
jgi:ribosome maturation factor RimP